MQYAVHPPHNVYQWMAYLWVAACGVIISLAIQWIIMRVALDPVRTAMSARQKASRFAQRVGEPVHGSKLEVGHLGTGLQVPVGIVEIIIYASSVVFGYPEFIAVWFGTKYVASYKTWAEEPVGRTFYNRSLIGSGVNILLGFFTGRVALWAIWRIGPH